MHPLLLMLDGHASHYQSELVRLAAKESVILFCLPPHCTHLAQPLDKGAFSPLKKYWHQECAKFIENNPGEVVTKRNFSLIFSQAWHRAMTSSTMSSSFRATGVYHFNREAIKIPKKQGGEEFDTGVISYLPLYSLPPKRYNVKIDAPVPKLVLTDESENQDTGTAQEHLAAATCMFSEELYQVRWENGYDIKTDTRYNKWVLKNKCNRAISLDESRSTNPASKATPSEIHNFLKLPELPLALKKSETRFRSARVLTSEVALQQMEEEERKKKEEEERKEHRRKEREERAQQRAVRGTIGCQKESKRETKNGGKDTQKERRAAETITQR